VLSKQAEVSAGGQTLQGIPSAASMRKLADRMEKIARDIQAVESTGVLYPLDEEELSGNFDDIVSGVHIGWLMELPSSLIRRAGMYRRWTEKLGGRKLRRDMLSRANRLALSVYVKAATNRGRSSKPLGRHDLVATVMKCGGQRANRSQLKRELQHFESVHGQAEGVLRSKWRTERPD